MASVVINGECAAWALGSKLGAVTTDDDDSFDVILSPRYTTHIREADIALQKAINEAGVAQVEHSHGYYSVKSRVYLAYAKTTSMSVCHAISDLPTPWRLSPRASARVVADVVLAIGALLAAGVDVAVPTPGSVLIRPEGDIRLVGLERDPGESSAQQTVEGAVSLFSKLISGRSLTGQSLKAAHDSEVRGVMRAVRSRPGPALGKRASALMHQLLSYEYSRGVSLLETQSLLQELASVCEGEPLAQWARVHVHAFWEQRSMTDEVETTKLGQDTVPDIAWLDGGEDDPTQEDPMLRHQRPDGGKLEPEKMPVNVGPPPEALIEPPALPSGFLETGSLTRGLLTVAQKVRGTKGSPSSMSLPLKMVGLGLAWLLFVCVLAGLTVLVLLALRGGQSDSMLVERIVEPTTKERGVLEETALPRAESPPKVSEEPVSGAQKQPTEEADGERRGAEHPLKEPPKIRSVPVETGVKPSPPQEAPGEIETRAEPPDLQQALESGDQTSLPENKVGPPYTLTIRTPDPALELKLRCNDGEHTAVGQLVVPDVTPGPCVVSTGTHETGIKRAHIVITGSVGFVCFKNGAPTCQRQ